MPVVALPAPHHKAHLAVGLVAGLGLVAIAGLTVALVWVLQGHMQQAQTLQAQWASPPRTSLTATSARRPAQLARVQAATNGVSPTPVAVQ